MEVWFDDGSQGVVDLGDYPPTRRSVRASFRSGVFQNLFIDLNTLCWPNGADIALERLYERLAKQ